MFVTHDLGSGWLCGTVGDEKGTKGFFPAAYVSRIVPDSGPTSGESKDESASSIISSIAPEPASGAKVGCQSSIHSK